MFTRFQFKRIEIWGKHFD